MESTDLDQLEKLIPENFSEWPPYAQVIHLQLRALMRSLDKVVSKVDGGTPTNPIGLEETSRDHEKRIKSLENIARWAAGLWTALAVAVGGAWIVHNTWGKGP